MGTLLNHWTMDEAHHLRQSLCVWIGVMYKRAVRKYVFFFQRGANWAFDGVFRAKLVSEDAFSLC